MARYRITKKEEKSIGKEIIEAGLGEERYKKLNNSTTGRVILKIVEPAIVPVIGTVGVAVGTAAAAKLTEKLASAGIKSTSSTIANIGKPIAEAVISKGHTLGKAILNGLVEAGKIGVRGIKIAGKVGISGVKAGISGLTKLASMV